MGQEADLEKAKIQVEKPLSMGKEKVVYHFLQSRAILHWQSIFGIYQNKEHHLQVTINGEPVCVEDAIEKVICI